LRVINVNYDVIIWKVEQHFCACNNSTVNCYCVVVVFFVCCCCCNK